MPKKLACRAGLWYNEEVKMLLPERCLQHPQAWTNLLRRLIMDTLPPPAQDGNPSTRICSKCKTALPFTPEFFCRDKRNKSGLSGICKTCKHQSDTVYRSRPEVQDRQREYKRRPEVREKNRLYLHSLYHNDAEFRENTLAKNRDYRNSDAYREHVRDRYHNDPEYRERIRGNQKNRYQDPATRDRILASNRMYRARPESLVRKRMNDRSYGQMYRARPEIQEQRRAWHKSYYSRPDMRERKHMADKLYRARPDAQEKMRMRSLLRIARKNAVPGKLTTEQVQIKLRLQRFRCYYCHKRFEKKNKKYIFQIDHVIPVSRPDAGPRHDMSFTVLACPRCNQSKSDKLPWEWPEGGRLL